MKRILIIIFLVLSLIVQGQNLVPNYSFEDYTDCPYGAGGIWSAEPWTSVRGSVDYYNECGVNGFSIPVSWGGGEDARTGGAYIGVGVWALGIANGREFAGTYISDSLIRGKKYDVEIYISMQDSTWFAIKKLGIYFSSIQPQNNIDTLLNLEPQVSYSDSVFLTEKDGWTGIMGSFIAEGGEQFLTIGNFDDDSKTDTLFVQGGATAIPQFPYYWSNAYYFIDDVSVIMDTNYVGLNETTKEASFEIYPNPAQSAITIETKQDGCSILQLSDITGRVALATPLTSSKVSIDISMLTAGIYTAVLFKNEAAISRKKIVIE